jgi:hypothetical protein
MLVLSWLFFACLWNASVVVAVFRLSSESGELLQLNWHF